MTFDLIIADGVIVDGTGEPSYRGSIAIEAGRIAALGEVRGAARRTIDAGGAVIAPGFVDIHTHYDAQIFWDPFLTISPWHGVTTAVIGSCGFGIAPTRPAGRDLILRTLERVEAMSLDALNAGLGTAWPFETFPEYLSAIEARGTAINVAVMVGHTPVLEIIPLYGGRVIPVNVADFATQLVLFTYSKGGKRRSTRIGLGIDRESW